MKLWKDRISKILEKVGKHEIFLLAGSFAYTTALALAPFLIITLSIIAFIGPETQQEIIDQLVSLLGPQAGESFGMIADNVRHEEAKYSGLKGVLSFLVVLVSASAIFSQMRQSLDKINEYKPEEDDSEIKGFFRDKIFSVGLVLGFIFLLIVSLGISTTLTLVLKSDEFLALKTLNLVVNFLVFSLLFAAMFRFIPSKTHPWRRCFASGIWATVFFLIGKSLIGIYLGKSAVGSSYGAAGSFIVLLVWLYYSALTLFLSYEFTNTVIFDDKTSTPPE